MTATDAEVLARLDFRIACQGNCLHGRPTATHMLAYTNPCGCTPTWLLCQHCAERLDRIVALITRWVCGRCGTGWTGPSFASVERLP